MRAAGGTIMTEQEWMECNDPQRKWLNVLYGNTSERKARLFACGCCRHLWHLLTEQGKRSIELGEQYADGSVMLEELHNHSRLLGSLTQRTYVDTPTASKALAAAMLCIEDGVAC